MVLGSFLFHANWHHFINYKSTQSLFIEKNNLKHQNSANKHRNVHCLLSKCNSFDSFFPYIHSFNNIKIQKRTLETNISFICSFGLYKRSVSNPLLLKLSWYLHELFPVSLLRLILFWVQIKFQNILFFSFKWNLKHSGNYIWNNKWFIHCCSSTLFTLIRFVHLWNAIMNKIMYQI